MRNDFQRHNVTTTASQNEDHIDRKVARQRGGDYILKRGGLAKVWKKVIAFALLGLLVACGGSSGENGRDGTGVDGGSEAGSTPSSSGSTYAYEDWDFQEVSLKDCEGIKSLGNEKSITLKTPDVVGSVQFEPRCLTDVKSDEISVTVVNTSAGNTHNFIVEGNEIELVVPAGEEATVEVKLGDDQQIGFECTIHAPRMFGAFFR